MRNPAHHPFRQRGRIILAALTMLLAATATIAQNKTTLRRVEILGLQRMSSDQVIAATGLRIGEPVDASMFDAAADKLMASGWFSTVNYRVRNEDNQSIVVFEVAEKTAAISVGVETLGRIGWTGNSAFSSDELSTAFALREGDSAPQAKIDQGLERVRKIYGRRGYLNAQVSTVSREVDGRRMNYQFMIREGQQYRMGLLTIAGLTPAETRELKSKWTLAAGAVFDDSYLEQFRTSVVRAFIAARTQRTGVRSKFDINTKPDAQKQTADVIITFK